MTNQHHNKPYSKKTSWEEIYNTIDLCMFAGRNSMFDKDYIIFLNRHGEVFTAEENQYKELVLTKIEYLSDKNIVYVNATSTNRFALSKDGKLYIWGGKNLTQCVGKEHHLKTPQCVNLQNIITFVPAGDYCFVALTAEGKVYYCGTDEDSKLFEPKCINSPKASYIAAGFHHILTASNKGITCFMLIMSSRLWIWKQ